MNKKNLIVLIIIIIIVIGTVFIMQKSNKNIDDNIQNSLVNEFVDDANAILINEENKSDGAININEYKSNNIDNTSSDEASVLANPVTEGIVAY